MEATINFNTKLKEAASFGQPITEYDPASKGFKDFQKLARELMGPAPRVMLDLTRYVTEAEAGAAERVPAMAGVESTLVEVPEGVELAGEGGGRNGRGKVGAELARRAEEIKASAQRELGITISEKSASASTEAKLEEFYGVKQLPEGMLFVAKCPNARAVALAGDFNGWQPEKTRMQSNGNADTFRALLPLSPGRYRYRLVVDGQWLADSAQRGDGAESVWGGEFGGGGGVNGSKNYEL